MTAGGPEPTETRGPGHGSAAGWSPTGADLELRQAAASIYGRLFQRPSAPVRLGRYTLLERLGEGGMGVVYAAYDAQLDRKVAIKIQRVLPGDAPERGERLLREALALARLSHPNIVAVFDAGEVDGQVYVAMEFIRGRTLKTWLGEQQRSWQQILAMLLQAGQGLAAAHGAGIIHRDFKPENVMLGDDGRVRVLDFGLARARWRPGVDDVDPGGAALAELTATGAVLGTPAYMSPEQFRGAEVDARTDQFSYCLTLWEAVYGERPFPGDSFVDLRETVLAGRIREPARDGRAPPWLRRALVRGLQVDPAARFSTMQDLLAALSRSAGRPRGWLALVLAGGVTAAIGAGALTRDDPSGRCVAGAGVRLGRAWNEARDQELAAAFAATGGSFAPATWTRVAGRVAAWAGAWSEMSEETCDAKYRRGELSDERFDRRMDCLRERLAALDAQLRTFEAPDLDLVTQAHAAIERLPTTAACVQDDLDTARALPDDPTSAVRVAALRGELTEIAAAARAGRERSVQARAETAVLEATSIGHAPTLAEARLQLAEILQATADLERADALFFAALLDARASGHRAVALRAMAGLGGTESILRDYDMRFSARWVELAFAELGEPTRDPEFAATLYLRRALIQKPERGVVALAEAERFALAALGPDHTQTLAIQTMHGRFLWMQARYDEATSILGTVRSRVIATLGPDHPAHAEVLSDLGRVAWLRGRHTEAIELHSEVIAIRERAYGPDYPLLSDPLNARGAARFTMGDPAGALPDFERALAITERRYGPDHIAVTPAIDNLTECAAEAGDLARARTLAERSLTIRRAGLPSDNPDLSRSHLHLGDVLLRVGEYAAAREHFERALVILRPLGIHPILLGDAQFGLARSLHALHEDPRRVRLLVAEAIASYERHGVVADMYRARAEALQRELQAIESHH